MWGAGGWASIGVGMGVGRGMTGIGVGRGTGVGAGITREGAVLEEKELAEDEETDV